MLLSLTSVSHEYWKELATRYAHHLAGTSSEQCIPYLLAVEKDTEAVEFYLQRRDVTSAFAVAKMSEARKECHTACSDNTLYNGLIEGGSSVETGTVTGVEAGMESEATYSLSGFMKAINMEETRKIPIKQIEHTASTPSKVIIPSPPLPSLPVSCIPMCCTILAQPNMAYLRLPVLGHSYGDHYTPPPPPPLTLTRTLTPLPLPLPYRAPTHSLL